MENTWKSVTKAEAVQKAAEFSGWKTETHLRELVAELTVAQRCWDNDELRKKALTNALFHLSRCDTYFLNEWFRIQQNEWNYAEDIVNMIEMSEIEFVQDRGWGGDPRLHGEVLKDVMETFERAYLDSVVCNRVFNLERARSETKLNLKVAA